MQEFNEDSLKQRLAEDKKPAYPEEVRTRI